MKVKEESEKAGLKLSIQKTNKITASGPITSWQIDGRKVKTVADFTFLGSKITVEGDCSHEIKRPLLLTLEAALASAPPPGGRCGAAHPHLPAAGALGELWAEQSGFDCLRSW